jgi:GntR family L-lactate dehydrogenase operon transcriptional regulator
LAPETNLTYKVLSYMAREEGPVGASALCKWLNQNGTQIGEATVGRLLRELDTQNLTQRAGYQGRTLTEQGQEALAQMRHEQNVLRTSVDLMEALDVKTRRQAIDVLVAGRAIEREAARLAALNATAADVAALEELAECYDAAERAAAIAQMDFAFHVLLAELSGNKVLQTAAQLTHARALTSAILTPVHLELKPTVSHQHREILAAIRARDPEAAERAMADHLEHVIGVLRRGDPR